MAGLALALATPLPAAGAVVDLVHASANVAGSSGGHAALRMGERVYHFQHGRDDVFRLVREGWPAFRYHYADLQNRTLRIARFELPDTLAEHLERRLTRRYWIQRKHTGALEAARRDVALLDALAAGDGVALERAGLFEPASNTRNERTADPTGRTLRARIERRIEPTLGAGFLARERARVRAALAALPVAAFAPSDPPAANPATSSPDAWPVTGVTLADRFRELAWRREALRVLDDEVPLAHGILLGLPLDADAGSRLDAAEREGLGRARDALEASVAALVSSRRPGAGRALLLLLARHRAVEHSLATGRLVAIDPFPDDALRIPAEAVAARRPGFEILERRAARATLAARRRLAASRTPEAAARALASLESALGMASELTRSLRRTGGDGSLRLVDGELVPARARRVEPGLGAIDPHELAAARSRARRAVARWQRAVRALHPYDLVRRNCATELAREVDAAFEAAGLAPPLGPVVAGSGLSLAPFVPFALFDRALARLPVREIDVVHGHRRRSVGALLETRRRPGQRAALWLRESNTLTSTLYRPLERDGTFLLFTDDAPWARPVHGAINLGVALGNAFVGVWTAPADGGGRLSRGLRGALFSLPELVFANVRKGSYEIVDPDPAEATTRRASSSPSSIRSASVR